MGLSVCTIIRQVIGEFTMQYLVNSNGGDVDTSVRHLYLSIAGKYYYSLSPVYLSPPVPGFTATCLPLRWDTTAAAASSPWPEP